MPRFLLILILCGILAGCGDGTSRSAAGTSAQSNAATGQPEQMPAQSDGAIHGSVIATMDSGGYTYVQVKTAGGETWAAGPQTKVAVGDHVTLPAGMLMRDFESKTLGRSFSEIHFVSAIQTTGSGASPPTAEPGREHTGAIMDGRAVPTGSVAKAAGGRTIAEIHAARAELGGQRVVVRGQVVKSTPNVMGRTWLHIQDGSAEGANGDLTVTTGGAGANVGDLVLVEGTAAADRDFGAGYRYDVIVEDAKVTVETR